MAHTKFVSRPAGAAPMKTAKGTVVGGVRDLKGETPYLQQVDRTRATTGRGSTQPTIFGVIGRTKMDPYSASLQDLVCDTKSGRPAPVVSDKMIVGHHNTERSNVSAPPATYIPGIHHGQVPYPGRFMSEAGHC